ncbi:MAG: helix-hairpin-helix domain-containing protein [Cytophagaceae bacterium]
MVLPKWIKDYLYFSKRDRLGIISLLFLIAIIYSVPLFLSRNRAFPLKASPLLQLAMDSLSARGNRTQNRASHATRSNSGNWKMGELFSFNPNSLSVEDWRRLGLPEKTIRTIQHYLSKGGKFYKPDDLKKIWGLPPEFYERVKGFISIEAKQPEHKKEYTSRPEKKINAVDINSADSAEWTALPGIGSRLSGRIVNFREKLGGFYSIKQVKETYGISDSTFQIILPYLHLNGSVRKLHLNSAGMEELKSHPYIRWKLANAIIAYRNQHGNFKSLEELKNILLMDEATFQKILPYLEL